MGKEGTDSDPNLRPFEQRIPKIQPLEGKKIAFLKVDRFWQQFLLAYKDQTRAQIITSRSQMLNGYPNRVHGTHHPSLGKIKLKHFLKQSLLLQLGTLRACLHVQQYRGFCEDTTAPTKELISSA